MSTAPQTEPPLTPPLAPPAANEPLVIREDRDGISLLTLNRPKARNALSTAMMAALHERLEEIGDDEAVKVVILQGAGPAFCAGHDLKELRSRPEKGHYEAIFRQCSRLMMAITRLPKPVIAKVRGIATAAGCQLVATCDLAVATESARFATPGVNIGLFCSTPMVALTRAVGSKPAMEMLLTGDMIPAQQALAFGLVNRVAPDDDLDTVAWDLARQIAAKSPLTLRIGKEAFYRQADMSLQDAYTFTSEVMTRNMLSQDTSEGIDAFLEKRRPNWRGC